jgi:DNA primase
MLCSGENTKNLILPPKQIYYLGVTVAKQFTPEILQDIKNRISLSEIVRGHVTGIKRKGRELWACCPFHNEKSASFHVKEDAGYYHCFGCGAHGNVFDFAMEMRGGTFPDTVEYLAGLAGITLKEVKFDPVKQQRRKSGQEALELTAKFFEGNISDEASEYIANRQLTEETIKIFRLGWAPKGKLQNYLKQQGFDDITLHEAGIIMKSDSGNGTYERFKERLMFPIEDLQNKVIGFGGRILDKGEPKYLNSSETTFFNKSHTLYNLNRAREDIRKQKQALIVEGYMDAIGLWQHGVRTAVAPMGTAITPSQIQLLWRFCDAPVVCLDGDLAGRNAAIRLARKVLSILEPGRTLQFIWMPEGEDPDSFIQKEGKSAFERLLQKPTTLDNVLWKDITSPHNLKTGDGRAAVDGAIIEITKDITNQQVNRQYGQVLRNKLWQSGRSVNTKQTKQSPNKQIHSRKGYQARFLLSILLRYPDLMKKFQEKFSEISFQNQEDKYIQDFLFKAFINKRLEKETWSTYLDEYGLTSRTQQLCIETLVDRLVTAQTAEQIWLEVWHEVHNRQHNKQTYKEALAEMMANPSDANWKKLQELKEENNSPSNI